MKLALPRGQQWFAVFVMAVFVLYLGNRLWTHRDITWRWKEEVVLADGSRVWIERERVIEVKAGGEPFQNARGPKVGRITIPDQRDKVVWDSPLEPMILERGETAVRWVLIASPIFCEDHYKYGSPTPPYIQFDYVDGQWTHKPVDPQWYGKKANLLMAYGQQAKHVGQSLRAEQVKKFNDRVYKISEDYLVVDARSKSNCYR